MIYLDNAATTQRKPQCVIDAVVEAMNTMGNGGRGAHGSKMIEDMNVVHFFGHINT